MKGRTPNKEEKEWLDTICQFGCIVCHLELGVFTEASYKPNIKVVKS